jgi:hypothetical protein
MPDRRDILKAGLAGGALAAVPGLLHAAASAPAVDVGGDVGADAGSMVAPYRVVVDERFAAARALGAQARARGWAVSAIRGDVTPLWYQDLALRWRAGPAPIAGLTTASALFCLERLAWDALMRLNLRIDHRPGPGGRIEHELAAQPGLLTRTDLAALARADFSAALPPLLARATHAVRGRPEVHTLAGAATAQAPFEEAGLVSWSIGTRSRAAA